MPKRYVTIVYEITEGDDLSNLPKMDVTKVDGLPQVIASSRSNEIARLEAIEEIAEQPSYDFDELGKISAIRELLQAEDNFDLIVKSWD